MTYRAITANHRDTYGGARAEKRQCEFCARFGVETMGLSWQAEKTPTLNSQPATLNQCCVTGMTYQSLSSKWPSAKARQGSMSFSTCDRVATQAPSHFQLNPPGRSLLGEISASLARPVLQSIQALRTLLEIRPNYLRRLARRTGYITLA